MTSVNCSRDFVRPVWKSFRARKRTRTASSRGSWTRTGTRWSCGNRSCGMRRTSPAEIVLSPTKFDALLYHLCVEYGFCLQPDARRKLCADAPADVTAFTDAVYRAEGLEPATANQRVYRLVHAAVERAFRGAGPDASG